MTSFLKDSVARAACDAIVDLVDGGTTNAQGRLILYSGSVPADCDAAAGTVVATLLGRVPGSGGFFGAAATSSNNAVATAATITDDSNAVGGTTTYFRLVNRDSAAIMQGACGTSGAELNFNSTVISAGAIVSVTSFTVTVPE